MQINLNELETERWENFQEKHNDCIDIKTACGGDSSLIITPTSIGMFISCQCSNCGEIIDITDLERV